MAITQRDPTTFKDDSFMAEHAMRAVIGGNDPLVFVPNLNLSFEAFSGTEQFFLNFNRLGTTGRKTGITFANRIDYATATNIIDRYRLAADKSFKWDVVFAVKPATNIYTWRITKSPGIRFFFQPPLTAREIADGASRPPEVDKSYAIYCDRANEFKDARGKRLVNYRCGKLGHLMRPVCIDALNRRTWADMDIVNDVLTITVPQAFLDSATYPVILDPTFGYTSTPATQTSLSRAHCGDALPTPYTAIAGDTITSYSFYGRRGGGVSPGAKVGLYDHDGSLPVNRIQVSPVIAVTSTAAWVTSSTVSHALTGGVDYVLAIGDETPGTAVNFFQDAAASGSGSRGPTGSTALVDPWNHNAARSFQWGIYATYTAGGGGGAVINVVAGFGSRAGFALQPPRLVINAGMSLVNEAVFADQSQVDLNALAALATVLTQSPIGSMDLSALSGLGVAIQQGLDAELTAESVVSFDLQARAAQTQAATLLMAMSHGLTTQAQLSPQAMLQTMSILALASGAGFAPLSLLSLQALGALPMQVALALQSELPVGLITAIVGLSSGVGVVSAGTLTIGGVTAHPLLAQLSPQSQTFINQLFSLGGTAAQGQGGGILHEMIVALGGEAAQSVEQQHVIGNILALALRQSIDLQTTNVSRALLAMGCTADQLALGSTIISQMLTMTLSGALSSVSASNVLNIGNIARVTAERLIQPTVTGEKFI